MTEGVKAAFETRLEAIRLDDILPLRRSMLDGVAPEVIDLLKTHNVNPVTFDVLRKMGAAASELMAAYRNGTLNLDLLTAFCVSEDQDRQRQVLEQMGPYTSVFAIRRAMTEAKVRADDRRVGFVGLEAYEAEGGAVLRDLEKAASKLGVRTRIEAVVVGVRRGLIDVD